MERRQRIIDSRKRKHQEAIDLMHDRMSEMSTSDILSIINLSDKIIDNDLNFNEAVEKTVIAMDSTYVINEHNVLGLCHEAGQKDGRNPESRMEQHTAQEILKSFETLKINNVFRK